MTNVLKLQGLTVEGQDASVGVLGDSSQSNNCGNGNSGLSVAC